jgi:TRAP-type C4-dicarboxylate transport system permease small subunit
VTLVAAAFLVVFNLAGLPYKGAFDNFLIVVSLVFCGLIVWYAWTWPAPG